MIFSYLLMWCGGAQLERSCEWRRWENPVCGLRYLMGACRRVYVGVSVYVYLMYVCVFASVCAFITYIYNIVILNRNTMLL